MHRIILDTDIGTNADDAVALSLVLKSPEIQLEGITTVYGDVHKEVRLHSIFCSFVKRSQQIFTQEYNFPFYEKGKLWDL